jgi:PadR family transcriptional regulator, regulatory protein PadR
MSTRPHHRSLARLATKRRLSRKAERSLTELDDYIHIYRLKGVERNRPPSRQTLVLLAELAQRPRRWHYGYELSRITELKPGTLYPILMRLCERGMLESKWQPAAEAGRPPRHTYRLTAAGVAFARDALTSRSATHSRTALGGGYA